MDKNRQILSESIDNIVRKTLTKRIQERQTWDRLVSRILKEEIQKITEDDEKMGNKERSVIQWLQQPEVNTAEIRRQLEGEPESQEEEDAKRSYFMKKVNQTNGKDFSDEEVNQLYAIKSGLGQ